MKSKHPLNDLENTYIKAHYSQSPEATRIQINFCLQKFRHWLDSEQLTLLNFDRVRFIQFDQWLIDKGLQRSSRTNIRRYLQRYFIWLHKKDILKTDPKLIFPRMKTLRRTGVVLPKRANRFLDVMRTQAKPTTVSSYQEALRRFYLFLEQNKLTLKRLKRSHLENFMIELKNKGLAESTRATKLINTRIYLRWLYENGDFKFNPDHLIRNRDLPRIPDRLPRYLAPEVDNELQKRLFNSNDIYHLGFFLMRHSGIRLGELRALKFNCIWKNASHQNFLKVEVGKLNTERLVPLDKKYVAVIHKIQEKSKQYCQNPDLLIHRPSGKKTCPDDFYGAFADITEGIKTDTPIVTHQLRHTYATQMLNSGMSMSALKEILGHKSFRMTAIYAKVFLQTVEEEYSKASKVYHHKFSIKKVTLDESEDPEENLTNAILAVKKKMNTSNLKQRNALNLISRRLKRIQDDLCALKNN